MKKIFCAFVCIFILINCKIAFAYDKAEIANEIQNFQQEIKADSSEMMLLIMTLELQFIIRVIVESITPFLQK